MKTPKTKEKHRSASTCLNRNFLKYFHLTKEEQKQWKTRESISLGEGILAHYGISFLKPFAFELEQLIDNALFIPKNNERYVTENWIRQLFGGRVGGTLLPQALLGVCYEEGIRTEKAFIEAFDYLGICRKLIDYWKTHQKEKNLEATDFEKIEKSCFDHWMMILKIPSADQKALKKELEDFQLFFCEEFFLHQLENKKLIEGLTKLYGSILVKNTPGISIKNLLEDPKLNSILNAVEELTEESQPTYLTRKYLKSIHSKKTR